MAVELEDQLETLGRWIERRYEIDGDPAMPLMPMEDEPEEQKSHGGRGRGWILKAAAAVLFVVGVLAYFAYDEGPDKVETSPLPAILPTPTATTSTPDPTAPPLVVAPASVTSADGSALFTFDQGVAEGVDPWIVDRVVEEIAALPELGATEEERLRAISEDGLTIKLSLDPDISETAARALGDVPLELDTASVTIDNQTGQIVAAVSRSGNALDVAQPAASARLVTYAAALEAGLALESIVNGIGPCVVETDGDPVAVENFGKSRGSETTLRRQVLSASRCAQAQLEAQLGADTVQELLATMSGAPTASSLPLVVETPNLTATEHTRMMAIAANDGIDPGTALVTEVRDRSGVVLFEGASEPQRLLSSETAAQLMEVMEANVTGGTGTRARFNAANPAGLTGTIDNTFDAAWFVGSANGLTTAIWVAKPDQSPMIGVAGINVTGGSFPAQAFKYLHRALARPGAALPETIGELMIDPDPEPPPLVASSLDVDVLPEVIACGDGSSQFPPNQGGPVTDAPNQPSPRDALESFLGPTIEARASNDPDALSGSDIIGQPPVATAGYVELRLPNGNVAYAWDTAAPGNTNELTAVVTVITVAPTNGGWTVTAWEASGC